MSLPNLMEIIDSIHSGNRNEYPEGLSKLGSDQDDYFILADLYDRKEIDYLKKVGNTAEKFESQWPQKKHRHNLFRKVAAVVGLFLAGGLVALISLRSDMSTDMNIVVGRGEQPKVIMLSDGTKIWLNSGSTLVTQKFKRHHSRNVSLQGEAYFDVAKDSLRSFVVHTNEFDIKVLGTAFNVRSYNSDPSAQTYLERGEIELLNHSGSHILSLTPGQIASFDKAKRRMTVSNINDCNVSAWKDGWLVFDGMTIYQILTYLSNIYSCEIEFSDEYTDDNTIDKGRVRRAGTIEELLDGLKFIFNFNYAIDNGVYKITPIR